MSLSIQPTKMFTEVSMALGIPVALHSQESLTARLKALKCFPAVGFPSKFPYENGNTYWRPASTADLRRGLPVANPDGGRPLAYISITCRRCNGVGKVILSDDVLTCWDCLGSGREIVRNSV